MNDSRLAAWMAVFALLVVLCTFEVGAAFLFGAAIAPPFDAPDGLQRHLEEAVSRAMLAPFLISRALIAIVAIFVILKCRRQTARSVGLSREHWMSNSLIGIGAVPVAVALVIIAMSVLFLVQPGFLEQMTRNAERVQALVPPMPPLALAGIAVVIGLYEELIFRGFLLFRIRRCTGSWWLSVVLTTALFVVLHMPDQENTALVSVTLLSLLFSLLTIWRRSIIPAVVAHTLWNFGQFMFLYTLSGESWR